MGCFCLFIAVLVVSVSESYVAATDFHTCTYYVDDQVSKQISVSTGNVTVFCLKPAALPAATTHVVFQTHVYHGNILTVSLDYTLRVGRYVKGADVGLVSVMRDGDLAKWYLKVAPNASRQVQVVVMATSYTASDPVPGGCNLEFPLQNDPNVYLEDKGSRLHTVQFAYGDISPGRKCGPSQQMIQYDVYQYFMNERDRSAEHYYDVIERMMHLDYVQRSAIHVASMNSKAFTELNVSAYRGLGTVFVVVISVLRSNVTRASYVPVVTYSCNDLSSGDCVEEGDFESRILMTVLAIVGIFVCCVGHRFLKTELFFFGYLDALLIVYILLARFSGWNFLNCLYVSLGAATIGGCGVLLFWIFVGIPAFAVLFTEVLLGYLVTSIVFNASPLGNVGVLREDPTYHVIFVCMVVSLLAPVAFAPRVLNVLTCAIVGSFLVILAADICLYGGVKYILMHSIWKSTTPGYINAYCFLPVQYSDILLYLAWVVLTIIGITIHYFLERRKPPFPEGPWQSFQRSRRDSHRRRSSERSELGDDDEHRPLLFTPPRPNPQHVWREQPVERFHQPADETQEWWHDPVGLPGAVVSPVVADSHTPPPPYSEVEVPSNPVQ